MSDPMTPAVPDPTVEALSEAEREVLCICPWDTSPPLPESTHTPQCSQHREAVERILAARAAAAPTVLRKRVGAHRPVMAKPAAIMCACDHEWRDVPSHAAHVCALLEDGAVGGG